MYTTTKYTKEAMLPHRGTWTLNEFILVAGQATSDNLAPTFSQIQYSWRCPTLDMAERILDVLERNAQHVAAISHCQVSSEWVTRTRVGLPNHAMAEITYRNLELAGPPSFGEEAKAFARDIQKTLGLAPMHGPECLDPAEHLLVGPVEVMIGVASARKRGDLLRRVCRGVDRLAHLHRDDAVILAVQHEQWRLHLR